MKIGTFNIQHGRDHAYYLASGEERIDLFGVAEVIRANGLEICALNEVRNQEGVTGLCNQARVIGEALGYDWVFAPAIDHRGGTYGNALVSRYPIRSARWIPIPCPDVEARMGRRHYEDRVLLVADLAVGGKILTVLVCHFGLNPDEKQRAVDTIRTVLSERREDVILMGDFNLTPDSEEYQQLVALLRDTAEPKETPLTFPSEAPRCKIDYVFVSESISTGDAYAPDTQQSDHKPYCVSATFETI